MMKRETNPLIKPLAFHKQNPLYAKLVLLFMLLGVTIFLFSSRSIDYSSPGLQMQRFDSQKTDTPVASESSDQVLETTQEFPAVDSEEAETDLHTSDKASTSSTSTDSQNEQDAPSTSTELHQDETAPSNSTELHEDETATSTSVESNEDKTEASTSNELNNVETAPSNSTELHEEKLAPSTPTDSHNNDVAPSTSVESQPSTSTELHNDETKARCDLFKGDWVPNPSGPAYNNYTCKMIEGHQDCITNGRPDSGYLYWKWKPKDCELPKFNPLRLLDFMRNKYFAFIGDSISRNHIQSMLCILSQVEEPKVIYRDPEWKSTTWIFPSYNFTIARIWSPFLLKAETFEDSNGVAAADIQLHVDKLDDWTNEYPKFDYAIFSGGQWYMKAAIHYENNTVQDCHRCPGRNLTDTGFHVAYRKAINLMYDFITSSSHKPRILFRTISPSHFEGGEWSSGGTCHRKVPFKANEVNMTYLETNNVEKTLYEIQMQEFQKAVSKASETGIEMKLFDTTQLSLLRPDGHPGEYRQYQPFAKDKNAKVQSDCLHWCMPGPIDSWNDLLMESLINT